MDSKRKKEEEKDNRVVSSFPDEVIERVLVFVKSHKDRNSVSLVCKDWYSAERWSRTYVFIGNCYSVSPEILIRRFPNIKSVTIKGKPRFSDFSLVPFDWGANIHPWLVLKLKRMTVSDESLEFLAQSFPHFKALSLQSCDGFSTHGLAAIATHCKNLTELDIQENDIDDAEGRWLSCFPESFTSLEVLKFASLQSEVKFDALEGLVARCKALRVLKVNKGVTLEQLQRLLTRASRLIELGTGSFSQELAPQRYEELEVAFSNCKKLNTLSGLWDLSSLHLPALYPPACTNLTYLNLSEACAQSTELSKLLPNCPNLQRLWVLDSIEDKGLEVVGSSCPLLEELRVFTVGLDPFDMEHIGVTEKGLIAMTNAAVTTVLQNCPGFTHFRLCIMTPHEPEYLTGEPMDEAFGSVVKTCTKLQRLSISGLLTDLTFEYIGKYAKNLETFSVAFAGSSDLGMQCVLEGCPKLRKLEIRDCPFGNAALLSGLEKYESMRSLWMSACEVTMNGCRLLAREMPRLNVEVIKQDDSDELQAEKVYVYRSVAGPRTDAPSFVHPVKMNLL
ncbi:hypothetical protein MKX01_015325 [Papaver californicum]|nr:hypothetical protein MKX01_015325 [Papaver californicum]